MAVDIKLGAKEKKLLTAVVAVFVFALVGPQFIGDYTLRYRSEQGGIRDKFRADIATVQQDLDSIEDRKEILRRYITRYQSLVERRVLSLPDAVQLVKHMKDISTERRQSATKFGFGDNVVLSSDAAVYTENSTVGVNVYPLNVEMGMLHDMDIFMFMESLNDRVASVAFPVQCSMQLEQREFAVANRENMSGSCRINWYAVSDPERNLAALSDEDDESESAQS